VRIRRASICGLLCSLSLWVATAARAAEPAARLAGPTIPDGLGVNIHFTDPRPGELEMLAAGGFRFIRMDFNWSGTERNRGVYDFAPYDRLLAALDKHHLRAVFILDYGNAMYDDGVSPRSDAGRAGFARWAVAAVSHFQRRGIVWEMWNEPNIFFWKPKPDPEAYAKLAVAVGRAIRQTPAIAHEIYIGPASSTIDFKFLETCFRAGCLQYWDAVSVHPYRQDAPLVGWKAAEKLATVELNHSGDPETVLPEYQKLRALIQKYAPAGKSLPLVSGEWGYAAGWQGHGGWRAYDPERQGKMLARQWLVNVSAGIPISIWYDWHDDGTNPNEPEHRYGTVGSEYHAGRTPIYDPKPDYVAAQTLTRTLAGYQFEKVVEQGNDRDYMLQFRPSPQATLPQVATGEKRAWAAWTTRQPQKATLSIPAGEYTIVSHLGNTTSATATADGLSLELSDGVQYIMPR